MVYLGGNSILIISAEAKNQPQPTYHTYSIRVTSINAGCSTDNSNNLQYYCLFKGTDNNLHALQLANNDFEQPSLMIFTWNWIDRIFTISGGLVLSGNTDGRTYYVMNTEIDYTYSNALGELKMDSHYGIRTTFILPNNTMVHIISNIKNSGFTFLSTDLSPIIPPKGMYRIFIIFYFYFP